MQTLAGLQGPHSYLVFKSARVEHFGTGIHTQGPQPIGVPLKDMDGLERTGIKRLLGIEIERWTLLFYLLGDTFSNLFIDIKSVKILFVFFLSP